MLTCDHFTTDPERIARRRRRGLHIAELGLHIAEFNAKPRAEKETAWAASWLAEAEAAEAAEAKEEEEAEKRAPPPAAAPAVASQGCPRCRWGPKGCDRCQAEEEKAEAEEEAEAVEPSVRKDKTQRTTQSAAAAEEPQVRQTRKRGRELFFSLEDTSSR